MKNNDNLKSVIIAVVPALLLIVQTVYFKKTKNEFKELLPIYNLTAKLNDKILIFNRVPKAGSQTLNHLIGELRERNNFTGYTSISGLPDNGEDSETTWFYEHSLMNRTIDVLQNQPSKANTTGIAFLKHQNFLNFARRGYQPPIYVNIVRHPVERTISWYYYVRQATYQFSDDNQINITDYDAVPTLKSSLPTVTVRAMKESIEDCFEHQRPKCFLRNGASIHGRSRLPDHGSQMAFFCGHDPICNVFESDGLLHQAKENVEKYFAVVGVLEQWMTSLEVLEAYIPRYFDGAREVYKKKKSITHVNKTDRKPKVSPEWKREIAKKLSKEIEFYEFCKQRLKIQHTLLKNL